MSVHTPVIKSGIYFITFTCYQWIPLFELTDSYNEVYHLFNILNKNGHTVLGYVIMPNHVHLLLYFEAGKQSLNTVIGNGKRFIGYEIIKRLKERKQIDVLEKLHEGVVVAEKSRNKQHQLWQGTFDVKECRTEAFVLQKLNYMHNNPCAGKWQLSYRPINYLHSSASFYEIGKPNEKVKDYRLFLAKTNDA